MKGISSGKRIKLIRKELGITQDELSAILGVGKSALSMIETGRAALSERNKNIIIQKLNINPDWIDGGKGDMFNCPKEECPPSHLGRSGLDTNQSNRTLPRQSIPLYNMEGMPGLVHLFHNQETVKPIDFIHIPAMPKCDGALYVAGDSMYPLLKSGDIILYKQINNVDDIFWGDIYLLSIDIDGQEYITIKYVRISEDPSCVKLVSQNPLHADKDIRKERIRALALIKASIRMNSIN